MRVLVAVLVASVVAPACGQGQATAVSAPFVSRLKAQAQGGAVILTWQDSADAPGPVTIYRHTEEISPETLAKAQKVAEVPHGTGSWSDRPPDRQPYFYAALASDGQGTPYKVLVAFRNKTLVPVAAEATDSSEVDDRAKASVDEPVASAGEAAPAAAPAPTAGSRPEAPAAAAPAAAAVPASSLPGPQPAAPASAAVAAAEAAGGAPPPQARVRPLPYLALERGVYSGQDVVPSQVMPSRRPLGSDAEEAVARLVAGLEAAERQPMQPVLLEIDRVEPGAGDQALLQAILRETPLAADSRAAEERLRGFLGVRRDAAIESRGRFYLGQALYFQRRTAEALVEMLPALDLYYAQARPWVDRCLDELAGLR